MKVIAEGRSGFILMQIKHWATRATVVECKKCKQTFKLNFGPKTKPIKEKVAGENLIQEIETDQINQSEKIKDLKSGKPKAWRHIPYDSRHRGKPGDPGPEGSVPGKDEKLGKPEGDSGSPD